MDTHLIGLPIPPPILAEQRLPLAEKAYYSAQAAMDDAGMARRGLDSLTIAACDAGLSTYHSAIAKVAPGRRISVRFAATRAGGLTDFSFVCAD